MFLKYGVTTMTDKNIDATWILAQREALKSGKIRGPRMFVSGAVMHGVYGFREEFDTWNYPDVTTVEEAKAYARTMIAAGVDILAVNQNITDAQLSAAIQVANEAGLPIYGHTRNIRRAAELGFKFAEHTFTIANALWDPEAKELPEEGGPAAGPNFVAPESKINPTQFPPLIDYLVKQGVYVNPTLVLEWRAATRRRSDGQGSRPCLCACRDKRGVDARFQAETRRIRQRKAVSPGLFSSRGQDCRGDGCA